MIAHTATSRRLIAVVALACGSVPAVVSAQPVTVRAIRLESPLRLDGRLDEQVYEVEPYVTDFIQQVPREGAKATERTDAWVLFDRDQLYIAARCWDSAPPEQWVANELRRDTNQLRQNDTFGVILDTFHDRRNGFLFYTNPLGARADQAVTDEGNLNADWNPVWNVRTGRFDGGWTVEMAIPFKSIRYRSGANQSWGINIRRVIRRKNEWTHIVPIPAAAGVPGGIFRLSRAATLEGLDLPPASSNVEVKSYAISSLNTDRIRTPPLENDWKPSAGVDAKYGLSANLTADVTVNTDFAQVEVDEQQVNLTRFSVVFPEKREFFLEGRGIFDFARSGAANSSAAPIFFYSRRIGLDGSRAIPIDAGGRLTGKVGPFGVGAMHIRTREDDASQTPATDFSVLRVKRDILRRSAIGGMVAYRSQSAVRAGESNVAYGADANFSFFQNLNVGGYAARSDTAGATTDNASYLGRITYDGDRYGAETQYLKVGDNFTPEVGLVRRDNFRRSFSSLRFSPRTRRRFTRIRQFTYSGSLEYLENGAGQLESRQQSGHYRMEWQTSDSLSVDVTREYERLLRPLTVATGVAVPVGSYSFTSLNVAYSLGLQRRISGTTSLRIGQFYNGTIKTLGYSGGRVTLLDQWSLEPSLSVNMVDLPAPSRAFTTTVVRLRSDYAFTPRMFVSGLVQYNSNDNVFSSNLRFRWEYLPGSEFFVVYTDERDTLKPGFPGLNNRAFVVKINRLMRF